MKLFNKIRDYLKGSISEMKKVVWPTKKQTINYSLIVIAMSLGMAVFFGVLDYALNIGLEVMIGEDNQPAVEAPTETGVTLPDFQVDDVGVNATGDVELETAPIYPTKSAE